MTIHASTFLDLAALQRQIDAGMIATQRHPVYPYTIYNYTRKAQFGKHWTPETCACRGLILDDELNVIARPFEKFFNLSETPETQLINVWSEPFEITEKLDGSLGVLFQTPDGPAIATRGSFTGPQAQWATHYAREHYPQLRRFPSALTLLFEIIYPENRVVVDYGARQDLVVIGLRSFSGTDFAYPTVKMIADNFGLPVVTTETSVHHVADLALMQARATGVEGWVVRFAGGLRAKVKTDDYIQLHRLRFALSPHRIHEMMVAGTFEDFRAKLPDDILDRVDPIGDAIHNSALSTWKTLVHLFSVAVNTVPPGDRKAFALHIKDVPGPMKGYLFGMLDGRDVYPAVLKDVDLRALGVAPEAEVMVEA